jgi:hypothetical protein
MDTARNPSVSQPSSQNVVVVPSPSVTRETLWYNGRRRRSDAQWTPHIDTERPSVYKGEPARDA